MSQFNSNGILGATLVLYASQPTSLPRFLDSSYPPLMLQLRPKSSNLPVAFVSTSSSTWHQRLGYPGDEVLHSLTSRRFISCNKGKSSHVCHVCQLGKHVKLPFHSSDFIVTKCFDIIHSDLWTSPIAQQPPTSPPGIPSPIEPQPARTHSMVTRSQSDIVKLIELKNDTWILVPRSSNVNLVRSMWLSKHKFHADGTLSRYKTRLVANGSNQQHSVDFDETFSPIVKPATIRAVLSLVVSRQWSIHQLDVKNAFLNSDLSETVYMHQPHGFVDSCYPNHVCLLQRSLYGLKHAPRAWFQRFAGYATRHGFSPSRCDSSLFIYTQGSQIIDSLHKEFEMIDLGALNYFLGIFAVRHPTGLFLSQKKYAFQLLERAHMVNCNPSRTPVDTDSKLGPDGVPNWICL
ncbi:ribonuclease H-like domain-containing protein [Tanacetum coccineum]